MYFLNALPNSIFLWMISVEIFQVLRSYLMRFSKEVFLNKSEFRIQLAVAIEKGRELSKSCNLKRQFSPVVSSSFLTRCKVTTYNFTKVAKFALVAGAKKSPFIRK